MVAIATYCQEVVVVDSIVKPRPGGTLVNLSGSSPNVKVAPCGLESFQRTHALHSRRAREEGILDSCEEGVDDVLKERRVGYHIV